MNKCSDELWTIAVALGCNQDTEPKAVLDRVLQRICDYQRIKHDAQRVIDSTRTGGDHQIALQALEFSIGRLQPDRPRVSIVQPTIISENKMRWWMVTVQVEDERMPRMFDCGGLTEEAAQAQALDIAMRYTHLSPKLCKVIGSEEIPGPVGTGPLGA